MSGEQPQDIKAIIEQAEASSASASVEINDDSAQRELEILFENPIYKDKGFTNFLQHEEFRLRKQDAELERKLRKDNANRAFAFSAIWAICIAVIVFIKGFKKDFNLSETEYIATIGTLSVTILTYYLVVVRHLFYRGGSNNNGEG